MFYHTYIDRLYVVSGLSRSGNHLFLTWLISSFQDGEVYFLNNISPKFYPPKEPNLEYIDLMMEFNATTRDGGRQIQSIKEEEIRNKLSTQQEMKDLLEGKKQKIKVLVFSIENKFADSLDEYASRFKNVEKTYKVIIIRDLLNLVASRLEAERKLIPQLEKERKPFHHMGMEIPWKFHSYETDLFTFSYWVNLYFSTRNPKYITFNYNPFILKESNRKELAKKLQIPFEKTQLVQSGFLTGSSFKHDVNDKNIYKYFMRWQHYENDPLMQVFLQNPTILESLCKDFLFCLNLKEKKVIIDQHVIPLETKNIQPKKRKLLKKNKTKNRDEK